MQINEIMTHSLETVEPQTTIKGAARLMRDADVGGLPVVDKGRVAGFITDRDIVIRSIANGDDPTKASVREVMTEEAFTLSEDQEIAEAQQLMKDKRVRRVVVVDAQQRPIGLVSLCDLACEPGAEGGAAAVLESVSQPTRASATHG